MFPENLTFSIAGWVNDGVDALVSNYGDVFRHISDTLLWAIIHLENLLRLTPWWLMLIIVGAIAWHATRKIFSTLLIVGLLFLVGAVGLWDKLMQTLALMLVATVIAVLLGIPLGILAARSNRLRSVLMPLLDIMQTMPSFVYLIPVLMLFGLGKVCMMSSSGISTERRRLLRAERMPRGMPISTEITVATIIRARVCISLSHRPTAPTRNSRPTITDVVTTLRVACQATPPTIASISHQGAMRSRPSRLTMAHSRVSEICRNTSP